LLFSLRQNRIAGDAILSPDVKVGALKHLAPTAAERDRDAMFLDGFWKIKAYDPLGVLLAKLFLITQNPFLYGCVLPSTINVPTRSLAKPRD